MLKQEKFLEINNFFDYSERNEYSMPIINVETFCALKFAGITRFPLDMLLTVLEK
jgi:hypothetical protein